MSEEAGTTDRQIAISKRVAMKSLKMKLNRLLPPPEVPANLDRTWQDVEGELGLSLPVDYKAFVDQYGTGLICAAGHTFGHLGVWNLRARMKTTPVVGISNVIREYEDAREKGYVSPWPFYPDEGGLLPFANTPSGDYFNWRTVGKSKSWDVVFYHFGRAEMVHLEGHVLTRVIVELLTQRSPLIPDRMSA